jgi:hypothetical protein
MTKKPTEQTAPNPERLSDESDQIEEMYEEDNLYLDRVQLADRGWTRSLTERFLPEPDRWATVDHWRNYTGKATYFVEKVMAAEQLVEFKKLYSVSISRRGLSRRDVNAFTRERTRVDAIYRSWINSLGPEDIKNMIAADELSAAFDEARALGYRTPHK